MIARSPDPIAPGKRLVYVLECFPADTLNFVYNEIEALEREGWQIEIHSLKPCVYCPAEAEPYRERTVALKPVSPGEMTRAVVHYLLRRPAALLWLFLVLPFDNRHGFAGKSLRTLSHVLFGVCFAYRLRGRRDHVHAHFAFKAATAALCAARLNGGTFSFTAHGSATVYPPARYNLPSKVRDAAFVVAVSEYNRRLMLELCPEVAPDRVVVNRTGILPDQFPFRETRPRREGPFELICVAKLYPIKNHAGLLRACALLHVRGIDFRLSLAGTDEGGYGAYLENLAAELGIGERVVFHGNVDHGAIGDLVAAADLLVLASHSEGIPVAVMEAMAVGTPVVAPLVTGVPELIEDSRDGWLVNPADPAEIAETIARALANPEQRAAVAVAARRRIEADYDFRTNARRLAAIFGERLDPHGRPSLPSPRRGSP